MNFYNMNQLLNEEITPDESGVSEPANDKTVSNMLDMMKGLLSKVSNDALKNKIQKFIDEMTGTNKPSETDNKEKSSPQTSEPPKPALDANKPMPAPGSTPSADTAAPSAPPAAPPQPPSSPTPPAGGMA